MYNSYTIEVFTEEGQVLKDANGRKVSFKQVKAKVYCDKKALGAVWCPNDKLTDKEQYEQLFTSVGDIIYGQEIQAKKKIEESESSSQSIVSMEEKNRT